MLAKMRCRLGSHRWVMQRLDGETFGECSRCKERDSKHFVDGMPISGPWRTSAGQVNPY